MPAARKKKSAPEAATGGRAKTVQLSVRISETKMTELKVRAARARKPIKAIVEGLVDQYLTT